MKNYCNENQKMPLYGIGPFLILAVAILSLLGIILSFTVFSGGTVNGPGKLLFYFVAFLLISSGFLIWFFGAVHSDMDRYIKENRLKTDGLYSWTRNPMYTGWWFVLIGILFLRHNLWILPLIPMQWILLTVVLKRTEERWLRELFGEEYEQYCKKVNRLMPCKKGSAIKEREE